jgi:hypothetical protein
MAWAKVGNIKGARGTKWYQGVGAPTASANTATVADAITGDMYLDTSTGDVYTF